MPTMRRPRRRPLGALGHIAIARQRGRALYALRLPGWDNDTVIVLDRQYPSPPRVSLARATLLPATWESALHWGWADAERNAAPHA